LTLHLKEIRKVAVIGWQVEGDSDHVIKGRQASLQVEDEEKRTVDNDGESNLFFPKEYSGSVTVVVEGSKSGRDKGIISIP
jgi:hypothetical protein